MSPLRCFPRTVGLLLAVVGVLASAGRQAWGQDAGLTSPLRDRFAEFVDRKEISGAVTLVGERDRVLSLMAVGLRQVEGDLPMRSDTLFRIASMTKPITATGVMMLVEEGKLRVDDPVETHLPEFRGQMLVAARGDGTVTLRKPGRPITLRDLLTHTSGLPGAPPPGLADLYAKRNHTLAEAVMAFSQRPLDFEPGSRWAYCNTGIDTLGRVIEVASGLPYEQFLQQRLFDPLGMRDTTFHPSPERLENAAATYEVKDGALHAVARSLIGPPEGAKYPIPAGGLYSTAPDLARFYQMILAGGVHDGHRYLAESTVREMTRVQTGDLKAGFTDGMGFGLGWGVVREPSGVTAMLSPGTFGHGGAFGTQAWLDPVRGRFAILMIQRVGLRNGDASDMRRELQRIAWEEPKP
jgi:CubicO group peptidase (beta-lactamase class C family)